MARPASFYLDSKSTNAPKLRRSRRSWLLTVFWCYATSSDLRFATSRAKLLSWNRSLAIRARLPTWGPGIRWQWGSFSTAWCCRAETMRLRRLGYILDPCWLTTVKATQILQYRFLRSVTTRSTLNYGSNRRFSSRGSSTSWRKRQNYQNVCASSHSSWGRSVRAVRQASQVFRLSLHLSSQGHFMEANPKQERVLQSNYSYVAIIKKTKWVNRPCREQMLSALNQAKLNWKKKTSSWIHLMSQQVTLK